jgi:hypothetical protein
MGERWNEKLARWRAFLVAKAQASPPIEVKPKRRWGGPMETPSDWWSDEGQRRVAPECGQCRDRACGRCPVRPDTDDAA